MWSIRHVGLSAKLETYPVFIQGKCTVKLAVEVVVVMKAVVAVMSVVIMVLEIIVIVTAGVMMMVVVVVFIHNTYITKFFQIMFTTFCVYILTRGEDSATPVRHGP